jgi:hypothetical protein
MNNNPNLRMNAFLIAVALLFTITVSTATVTMLPAAYAEGDDDGDEDEKTDGNKIKAEDESTGIIADCDKNEASSIFICTSITPVCRPGAVCVYGQMDPTLLALPISWR